MSEAAVASPIAAFRTEPMANIRPRRSMLFMPGSNARALEKAKSLPCDGVIFDLEDAVSPGAKAEARAQVRAALLAGGFGSRELIVRINGMDTPWWQDDLAALAGLPLDGVLLPKVEGAEALQRAEALLLGDAKAADVALWAMLETPRAFLRAEEIATSTGRLAGLVIGTNDLVKDLHGRHTHSRLPVVTALGIALLVARTYGLAVLDGVYNDFNDGEGFRAECSQGRDYGFDGKTLIHPAQIEAANEMYGVSEEALAEAQRLIKAFEAVAKVGKGVAVLDGRMIEDLHVAEAKRLTATAAAITKV
jgi:citrate lyase beta subunit